MYNKQRGVKTIKQGCRIKINTKEHHLSNEAYSKSIDESFNQLFKHDINPNLPKT